MLRLPWQPGGGGQSCPPGVMSFEGHVGIREAWGKWTDQDWTALTVINVPKERTGVSSAVSHSGYLTPRETCPVSNAELLCLPKLEPL